MRVSKSVIHTLQLTPEINRKNAAIIELVTEKLGVL